MTCASWWVLCAGRELTRRPIITTTATAATITTTPHPPPSFSQLEHVRNTEVLVLLQSKGVLTRPWVLLELYTAITNNVPIVALNIAGRGYDYGTEASFMLHLDTMLEERNPGTTGTSRCVS